MRKKKEVLERFKKGLEEDKIGIWYEFNGKLLVPYLPFEYLRNDFFKEEVSDKEIRDFMEDINKDSIMKEMKEYLSFAWEKCNNERGISANRSIEHFIEWIWLIDEVFSNKIYKEYNENYHSYGANILEMVEDYLREDEKIMKEDND